MLYKQYCQKRLASTPVDEPMVKAKPNHFMAHSKTENFQFSIAKLSYFEEK